MKTIFIELSDGIFEVIIDNDKPLKETPKSYKFREFAKAHSLYHSEYLSNIMSIYDVKDGSLRYSIFEDGCFYPIYGTLTIIRKNNTLMSIH